MGALVILIATYLLGGVTLLPGILFLVFLHTYLTSPQIFLSTNIENASTDSLQDSQDDGQNLRSAASAQNFADKLPRRHTPDVASGYFAVCREYIPGGVNGKPPERTTPAGAVIATESPSVYRSMYRSIFDRKQGPSLDAGKSNGKTVKRGRNVFYVVLRHGHLMLYEDAEQLEVRHVISLELHNVEICGSESIIQEGELWIKRNAIRLDRKSSIEDPTSASKPFHFFSDNCSEKEDFYFALLQNQGTRGTTPNGFDNIPRPQQYETKHIVKLVQNLHSSEEQLQTRWINALVGRLFLALYKTRMTEDFIRKKVTKKIARARKPAFLSGIVLQNIEMGDSAPHITNPRLKDLTVDGDCCAEADFRYAGNFRIRIAATARIDLGARFKAREVNLVLAVIVKRLNGHVLLKFKPPPSNRLWISFEKMPDMEMTIQPIISSRDIGYAFIQRAIESRIREVLAETIVLPHWDDIPFTDTTNQPYRGGIWAEQVPSTDTQPEHTKIPDEAPEDEAESGGEADSNSVEHYSPHNTNERAVSMSVLPEKSPVDSALDEDATLKPAIINSSKAAFSTGAKTSSEPPRALRSRSFACAANPLLSMDHANVDSAPNDQNRSKQPKDAASAIKAISSRSRPTSPSDTNTLSTEGATTLWENSRSLNERHPLPQDLKDGPKGIARTSPMDGRCEDASLPSPHTSAAALASPFSNENPPDRALQGDTRNITPERKQSMAALGAATAAAKNWGWNVLGRNANQKNPKSLDRDPTQPMGRGRPLPPPGEPLPFPEGARSRTGTSAPLKRKAVAPPPPSQRRQGEVKARSDAPPPLPRRNRQSSAPTDSANEEDMLVVKAPPEETPNGLQSHEETGGA